MDSKNTQRLPDFIVYENGPENPLSERTQEELTVLWQKAADFKYPTTAVDQAWADFSAQIQPVLSVHKRSRKFEMFRWVAAAIVVLTIGFGLWQRNFPSHSTYTDLLQSEANIIQKTLPDGSRVTLNKGSVLEIKSMNAQSRVLELKKGEAFFKVTHNDIPFKLITDKGIITVMGTEFDVKNNADQTFSVFLKNGQIQFENNQNTYVLKPGELLEADADGHLSVRAISDSRASVWMDGHLSFDQTALSEMVKVLEETYQVKFKYDAGLANEKLTISFDGLNAEQSAQLLSKTLNSVVSVEALSSKN